MSKIDLVSFWYSNSSIGMAPYVNTTADGGHIDYEGVSSKVDLGTRIQSIMSALPDFFSSYTIKLTDVNLGGVLVSKAECVLKASSSSDVPDYSQILTNINTNLTDLNNKLQILTGCFTSNTSNSDNAFQKSLLRFLGCFSEASLNDNSNNVQSYSYLRQLFGITSGANNQTANQIRSASYIRAVSQCLQQSVTPHANVADVISALNTTIDSKQDTTIVNNEVTPLAEINIDVPFEVKNLKKSDVENL